MQKTSIQWTSYSVNPFKLEMPDGALINACVHKSTGCTKCYAEGIVGRFWRKEWGAFPGYTAALLKLGTPFLVEEELQVVLRLSIRIAEGKADPAENKIFWNDMTDEFLDFWPDEFIDKCFAVRALTPNLIHQVLTKRPERARDYLNNAETRFRIGDEIISTLEKSQLKRLVNGGDLDGLVADSEPSCKTYIARRPLPNVHLGVSCEDQKTADERIPLLLQTPAAVRWISAEPLLGALDIKAYLPDPLDGAAHISNMDLPPLDWIVVGGESGTGARPTDLRWLYSIKEQCDAAGVPVFIKQLGTNAVGYNGTARFQAKDRKGGDINEFPPDLQVRSFPDAD